MSKLKADNTFVFGEECLAYKKSEADKYIGELKKERDWLAKDRAQAYDDLEKRAQLNIKQEESIRHHKYRRCLENAERCNDKIDNPVQYDDHDDWLIITEFWERWHKRWLELAEKFKPNNSTAQQGKG